MRLLPILATAAAGAALVAAGATAANATPTKPQALEGKIVFASKTGYYGLPDGKDGARTAGRITTGANALERAWDSAAVVTTPSKNTTGQIRSKATGLCLTTTSTSVNWAKCTSGSAQQFTLQQAADGQWGFANTSARTGYLNPMKPLGDRLFVGYASNATAPLLLDRFQQAA